MDDLAERFAGGKATVHRAISVDDIDAFLAATAGGAPLGPHWTTESDRASTCLHGGEWRRYDLLLTGRVEAGAVDWGTTFQQRFAHPCEMEVFVGGEITLLGIVQMETGEELPWTVTGPTATSPMGEYAGSLGESGAKLTLTDELSNIIVQGYSRPYPPAAFRSGRSPEVKKSRMRSNPGE